MNTTSAPSAYRLAAVTLHPVQYQAPLFQRLAAHEAVDLMVFYGDDRGVAPLADKGFGRSVQWDRPLLDGYPSVFLSRGATGLLRRLAADARIIGHLRRGRFDAVFVHSYGTPLSLFAYVGALASGTPVLLRTESELLRRRAWWISAIKALFLRPLLAATAAVLVIGEANRRFFDRYGVDRARHFFVPYSVDNDYWLARRELLKPARQELRRQFGFPDDVAVIGFSGKLIPRKGVGELIDAVGALQQEGLRAGLLLLGDGPLRSELEQRARTRGLQWVTFAGFKNQSELPACYACLDVFVLPARFDTWGLVLNEAMAFGLPVVTTNMVGAGLDLVEEGMNGSVYRSGDVEGLTRALKTLVTDAHTRATFGRRSQEIVGRFSYEACVRGIVAALQSVAKRGD